MVVKELIEKLETLPPDAQLQVAFGFKVNALLEDITRNVDRVSYDEKTHSVQIGTNASLQLFY